ncbi:MAG TPA: DUF2254 domain-containing protein [Methylocella sp.]|nr:DUF2254 domain-containing protein [Methylocella sp.]
MARITTRLREKIIEGNPMRLPLFVRSVMYALRGGFLVRPLLISLVLGLAGMALSSLEESYPVVSSWVPTALFPSRADPQIAQIMLGTVATSVMTVVSIVFAILLMTLTLASMQFSPRILVSFVRDRVTQWTLGFFLGTFLYCMAALPAARSLPRPFAPVATVTGALVLVLISVVGLIYFIHHISQAVSVNHIIDRIARETEDVIDEIMPYERGHGLRQEHASFPMDETEFAVINEQSGYICFVDIYRLLQLARAYRLRIRILRAVGHFVPRGVPLFTVSRESRLTPERTVELHSAFIIGPIRTMQQDVEFGVLQIVDIALKAISPAVNDPSTAITCVDQLTRILIRWIGRAPPPGILTGPPHVVRVIIPWPDFRHLLDTAFEQIRHYSVSDVAVSLRLLRALKDLAATADDERMCEQLVLRGRWVVSGCATRVGPRDLKRLESRLAEIESQALRHQVI